MAGGMGISHQHPDDEPRTADSSRHRYTYPARSGLLTDDEQIVVYRAGQLWNLICSAIPDGPTRDADLRELIVHVHAIQHAFMANAAARAYPDAYRRLGSTLAEDGA
jgi:hypothetical protein